MNNRLDLIEQVKTNLQSVYDPEISVNIYDLGLVYNVDIDNDMTCNILMSLTSAWCPSADDIVADVKYSAMSVDGIKNCTVEVTFDPQWGPHMMSDDAKFELGLWEEL
jgi:metal-sulfur cluster biosynthetic enzyme